MGRRFHSSSTTERYDEWGPKKFMPIFKYFAITGLALLALLLPLSAYLEPSKAPLVAIGTANAHSGPMKHGVAADQEPHFLRLRQIPINAIKARR